MWSGTVPQQPPTRFTQPSVVRSDTTFSATIAGRLVVTAVLVGEARVRDARDREARERRERPQMVGHEVGTGGAVEPDPHSRSRWASET